MAHPILHEELELLRRILRPETFRFVLAEYNHTAAIAEAEAFLRRSFPRRPLLVLHIAGNDYRRFSLAVQDFGRGIVLIPDFELLFRPEHEDFCIAFNQRRDWLAMQPLALVCFFPLGAMCQTMDAMPDFWSRRDAELMLAVPLPAVPDAMRQPVPPQSTLGGQAAAEKRVELQRLRSEISACEPSNFSLLDNLYRQLLPLLEDLGEYQDGLDAAYVFQQLASQQHQPAPDSLFFAHDRLARFHQYLGHLNDADRCFRQALEWAEQADDGETVASAQNNYANLLRDMGRYEEAKRLLEKAVEFVERRFGTDYPTTAARYSNLATVLQDLGDYADAKVLLEKALVLTERNYGTDHPTTAAYYSNLAAVLWGLGDYDRARQLLNKALDIFNNHLGAEHPHTRGVVEGLKNMDELENK